MAWSSDYYQHTLSKIRYPHNYISKEDTLRNYFRCGIEIEENCRCTLEWIDERCFKCALLCYYPNETLLCWGCRFGHPNRLSHTCEILDSSRYALYKTIWEDLVKKTLLEEEHLHRLFDIYEYLHRGKKRCTAFLPSMKRGIEYIVSMKLGEVLHIMLEKDRQRDT